MWAIGQYDESQDLDDQMVKQTQAAANVSAQDLEKLTPSEKKVFLLWNNERLSYKEIAAELSKSPQTVKAQLASARKTLNPYLTREG
jgi:RNA polymerase sigma factor (sigma-70 family)